MVLGLPEPEIMLTFFIPPHSSISGASLRDFIFFFNKSFAFCKRTFIFLMWYITQALFLRVNCYAHISFSLFKFLFGILFFLDIYQKKFVANLFPFTLLVSCSLMWGEGCGGSLGKLLAVQAPAGWLHFSCCAREQGGVKVLSPRQKFLKTNSSRILQFQKPHISLWDKLVVQPRSQHDRKQANCHWHRFWVMWIIKQ